MQHNIPNRCWIRLSSRCGTGARSAPALSNDGTFVGHTSFYRWHICESALPEGKPAASECRGQTVLLTMAHLQRAESRQATGEPRNPCWIRSLLECQIRDTLLTMALLAKARILPSSLGPTPKGPEYPTIRAHDRRRSTRAAGGGLLWREGIPKLLTFVGYIRRGTYHAPMRPNLRFVRNPGSSGKAPDSAAVRR